MSNLIYFYDKETGEYLNKDVRKLCREKTVALKESVYLPIPENATTKTPIKEVGKCWFYNEKWHSKPRRLKNL